MQKKKNKKKRERERERYTVPSSACYRIFFPVENNPTGTIVVYSGRCHHIMKKQLQNIKLFILKSL